MSAPKQKPSERIPEEAKHIGFFDSQYAVIMKLHKKIDALFEYIDELHEAKDDR